MATDESTRRASLNDGAPALLVTIDTEGDDVWARRRPVETRNAAFLPRFQALCETYGVRPTYLTNYEMACAPAFRELGRDVLARGAAEIGMHLHAWHSPPGYALTADDARHHPYLIEYPTPVMRAKINALTDLLEDTFATRMVSHRAGRWSFNETYARLLVERGYRVDCSVTPHVSWARKKGDPRQPGGTDFSRFPDEAYFLDPDDVSRPGRGPLLEVPVTIVPARPVVHRVLRALARPTTLPGRALRRLCPVQWLRPNGRNRRHLLAIVERTVAERRRYVEFMLHSSELMPGGSPTFPTRESIERLYEDLEHLWATATRWFRGATLAEFHDHFRERSAHATGRHAA